MVLHKEVEKNVNHDIYGGTAPNYTWSCAILGNKVLKVSYQSIDANKTMVSIDMEGGSNVSYMKRYFISSLNALYELYYSIMKSEYGPLEKTLQQIEELDQMSKVTTHFTGANSMGSPCLI